VDEKPGKQYERVKSAPIFSLDSKHLAYAAMAGDKWLVVVDGNEGNRYDSLLAEFGGRIVFDSPTTLHYLALKGHTIYLVEETLR
jgi:hypothetical protein